MRSASTTAPVKTVLRSLFRALCLLLAAIGALGVIGGASMVAAFAVVWFQEGRLLPEDGRLLGKGALIAVGAALFVYVAWRFANWGATNDRSFRLTKSTPAQELWSQRISLFLLMFVTGVFGFCSVGGSKLVGLASAAIWMTFTFACLHLHIFLHELGHLTAAWLMKFDLRKMQIGVGREIWSHSLTNGPRIELRAQPIGGFMMAIDPRKTGHFRIRRFVFVAAGPLTDATILWVGYQLVSTGFLHSEFLAGSGGVVVAVLFACVALTMVSGLIPQTVSIGGRKMWSDGYWLWLLATTSNRRLEILAQQIKWSYALEAARSCKIAARTEFQPLLAARVHASVSLDTFRRQHSLLGSRLLRRPRP
jgi:hypothetical protein